MKNRLKFSRNLTMLTDFYELTMANGFLEYGFENKVAVFDMFFRKIPDNGGFAIFAGLSQLIDFLSNISFTKDDLEYLRSFNIFSDNFLNYLKNFKFNCDVWSVPEGTPIFPNEPVIIIKGPIIQTQFIETILLNTINYQSLIATKANRIVRAAQGKPVLEFGARRAQGYDAAIYGSRAAYMAGCDGTSCVEASAKFNIPPFGTMAHSWIQSFDSELNAFKAYAKIYPNNCVFLVDTYNVLKSGVPNAIKVFDEYLGGPESKIKKAIRIDSGDISYFSKKSRQLLDKAGYKDVKIIASNSLDEFIIRDLILQNSCIDMFAVGENLITSKSSPVFGGVYKLSAVEQNNKFIPRIKISESIEKVNIPHFKKLYRFFNNDTNKATADLVTLHDENIEYKDGITIFDPNASWKKKLLTNVTAKEMLIPIFKNGKLIYKEPDITDIRKNCLKNVDMLWDEVKRFEFPHKYYVDLSFKLWDIKNSMLSDLDSSIFK